MNLWRLIGRNLAYHWRINATVALGVAAATAVLTGALLVGDSMRGSLRQLTLDRLGRIDAVLVTDRFFRPQLADELAASAEFKQHFAEALSTILVQGTVERRPDSADASQHRARASHVTVLGCDQRLWELDSKEPSRRPARGEVVLNAKLAADLSAKIGDTVILRIGESSDIPADSPLGRKTETTRSRPLTVVGFVSSSPLGRFSLRPNQREPYNAFVAPETLQQALDQRDKVNAIFVTGQRADVAPSSAATAALASGLHPTLEDYGLAIRYSERGYFHLFSNRMLLEPAVERAALAAFAEDRPQPVLTYLANYIMAGEGAGKIPYSTITALDLASDPPLGPLEDDSGKPIGSIEDDEIVLNRWAADDLAAQGVKLNSGDPIRITYFEPETTHGKVSQRDATFKLKTVVELAGAADDPDFTPELKGVTDQRSIADWNPPFPFELARVRATPPNNQDDAYWQKHKATPKAFVNLATGRRLWGSRFGRATAIRFVPPADATEKSLAGQLELDPAALGFELLPVKELGLAAASGTTPFNLLFLGFSFFIIAAAVMLVALLFRLGLEQRAAQIGTLAAIGWTRRQITTLMAAEGLAVSAIGGAAGVALGVGYAWLMLAGLKSPALWLKAISSPFLELYVPPATLLIGFASGVMVSLATILLALRGLRHVSIRRLLAGQTAEPVRQTRDSRRGAPRAYWAAAAMAILAVALGGLATRLGGEAQAGAFFGAGTLVLAACLTALFAALRSGGPGSLVTAGGLPLVRLAGRNGARNSGRSTLTIGLIASASFLIVAISAFQLDPAAEGTGPASGSGGFSLIAESDQPIYQDLSSRSGRADLGFSKDADRLLADCEVTPLRLRAGDDASCLNLYQPRQPRVLGVTSALVDRGGFAWAETAAKTDAERKNPWLLLDGVLADSADGQPIVPVVLDMNTALYSLHLGSFVSSPLGKQFQIDDGRGGKLNLQVVGLLQNSILQGDLLIAERAFLKTFPEINGYRVFLVGAPEGQGAKVVGTLEDVLGDYGFDATTTIDRLSDLLAVQNTYLFTFQSLGGLGLLLGTFGLATVQLRSVLERRGELALLRAVGFRRRMLAALVMIESGLLLVAGLAVGVAAALVAVLPHLLGHSAAIPAVALAATLSGVLVVGLLASLIAVRATLRAQVLPALRGD